MIIATAVLHILKKKTMKIMLHILKILPMRVKYKYIRYLSWVSRKSRRLRTRMQAFPREEMMTGSIDEGFYLNKRKALPRQDVIQRHEVKSHTNKTGGSIDWIETEAGTSMNWHKTKENLEDVYSGR